MRHLLLIFFLLAGLIATAPAQTTNQVPDSVPDYSTFGQFISVRNIFNPDRYPLQNNYRPRIVRSTHLAAPFVSLVGTMAYQKGMFAFFDGYTSDYRKVLQTNGLIAGYTVKSISSTGVTLVSSATNVLQLSIGSQLRQYGTNWELAGASDAMETIPETTTGATTGPTTDTSTPAATTPADSSSAPNDILKRLMQNREQSLK